MCFLSTMFPNAPAHPLYFLTSPLAAEFLFVTFVTKSNFLRNYGKRFGKSRATCGNL